MKIKKRVVKVSVEKMDDRFCGKPTGQYVWHVMEAVACRAERIIQRGCPLGRGGSEQSALADFCFRANGDDLDLCLRVDELEVVSREDHAHYPALKAETSWGPIVNGKLPPPEA